MECKYFQLHITYLDFIYVQSFATSVPTDITIKTVGYYNV